MESVKKFRFQAGRAAKNILIQAMPGSVIKIDSERSKPLLLTVDQSALAAMKLTIAA